MERLLAMGFVGCGRATTTLHLPALASTAGIRVAAVCDTSTEALHAAQAQSRGAAAYADYRDLIADPAVDAVAVCTPGAAHAEAAVAALSAGKPTFIEKPLALNVADCDRMIEAAAGSCVATVGHNLRCHALVERARASVLAGDIGRVQVVRSVWTAGFNLGRDMPAWRKRRDSGGGALTELAVHHIDLWRFLTGREIALSQALSFSETSDDQAVVLQGRLDDGTLCSTAVCQRSADSNEVELFGDAGRIRFSVYRADSFVRFKTSDLGGGIGVRLNQLKQQATQFPQLLRSARRGGVYIESYARQWRRFIEAARGTASPVCSLREGRAAIEALCALHDTSPAASTQGGSDS